MDKYVYVERADPNAKGYKEGTRRWFNVIDRYSWANEYLRGTTLDMPCGMGWGTSLITGIELLIGIDISPEAISRAESLYGEHALFLVNNMLDTGYPPGFFDSVVCCEGYEHVKRKDQFVLMEEIHRITRPGGLVFVTVPFAKFPGDHTGNKFHLYEPTIEEVEETFVNKFEIIEVTKPNVARYRLKVIK